MSKYYFKSNTVKMNSQEIANFKQGDSVGKLNIFEAYEDPYDDDDVFNLEYDALKRIERWDTKITKHISHDEIYFLVREYYIEKVDKNKHEIIKITEMGPGAKIIKYSLGGVHMNKTRLKRIYEVAEEITMMADEIDSKNEDLQDILSEEEDYYGNMPENLLYSYQGERSSEAIDVLNDTIDKLESMISRIRDSAEEISDIVSDLECLE